MRTTMHFIPDDPSESTQPSGYAPRDAKIKLGHLLTPAERNRIRRLLQRAALWEIPYVVALIKKIQHERALPWNTPHDAQYDPDNRIIVCDCGYVCDVTKYAVEVDSRRLPPLFTADYPIGQGRQPSANSSPAKHFNEEATVKDEHGNIIDINISAQSAEWRDRYFADKAGLTVLQYRDLQLFERGDALKESLAPRSLLSDDACLARAHYLIARHREAVNGHHAKLIKDMFAKEPDFNVLPFEQQVELTYQQYLYYSNGLADRWRTGLANRENVLIAANIEASITKPPTHAPRVPSFVRVAELALGRAYAPTLGYGPQLAPPDRQPTAVRPKAAIEAFLSRGFVVSFAMWSSMADGWRETYGPMFPMTVPFAEFTNRAEVVALMDRWLDGTDPLLVGPHSKGNVPEIEPISRDEEE